MKPRKVYGKFKEIRNLSEITPCEHCPTHTLRQARAVAHGEAVHLILGPNMVSKSVYASNPACKGFDRGCPKYETGKSGCLDKVAPLPDHTQPWAWLLLLSTPSTPLPTKEEPRLWEKGFLEAGYIPLALVMTAREPGVSAQQLQFSLAMLLGMECRFQAAALACSAAQIQQVC